MNRKSRLKLCALTLATTLGALTALNSIQEVQAAVVSNDFTATSTSTSTTNEKENIKIIDNDTFEVDGVTYSISAIANSIKADSINPNTSGDVHVDSVPSKAAKVAMKAAVKWVKANKVKIMAKIPAGLKKYIKIDTIVSAADQFIGISSGIEDLFHRIFRSWGMPETANKIITNIIMIALPI